MNDNTVITNGNSLDAALINFGEQVFADLSRYRFAEEREWYEAALFYQRRQWLKWDDSKRRWSVQKPDSKKPRPMPVSNYFAKTINANANALGAELPKMLAMPMDDDPGNRRAADMAEKAKGAIDKESGMHILNAQLAKHVPLWGMGVTKDTFDTSLNAGVVKVPQMTLKQVNMLGCFECGGTYQLPDEQQPVEGQTIPCPQCGSLKTTVYPEVVPDQEEVAAYSRGKITTEVIPIFEIFLPRDCQNPNLAKRVLQRSRKSLGTLRRMYPDKAEQIKADQQLDINETYLQGLRSLVNYNHLSEMTSEGATISELWLDWDELPEKMQEKITEAYAGDVETLDKFERAGLFLIWAPGCLLDFGPNPIYDEDTGKRYFPFTFFQWEIDPANTYNKGIAVDLIPLQKRLNRIDSLIELAMMSNAAGKWLWPKTQTTRPPTGSPNDVVEFDPIGEGKIPPTFVQPSPFHASVWQLRNTILADFNALGLTEAVSQGRAPSGVDAFRALAYLGSKAAEQINTQRFLWELAHQLRYEKCLCMAKLFWDEPRKVKVSGFNGKFQAASLTGNDLKGYYEIEFVPDSSRPQTLPEKIQAFQLLLQGGMIDPTDSATREYVLDLVNLDGINLNDHMQYSKAERDLDKVKRGEQPTFSPYAKWDIFLKVFATYTLTEEFEQQDDETKQRILAATEWLNQQVTQVQMGSAMGTAMGGPPQAAAQLANAVNQLAPNQAPPGHELQQVPGQGAQTDNVEHAAEQQGEQVANQLP